MKRIVSSILIFLFTLCSLFAENNNVNKNLTLTYNEPEFQRLELYYGSDEIDFVKSSVKNVSLKDGKSLPITVKWNGNINNKDGSYIGVTFRSEDGFVNKAANHKVPVYIAKNDVIGNGDVKNSNGKLVGKVYVGHQDTIGFVSFQPNGNTRDYLDIATLYVTWDQHNWIAGEYRCDIIVEITGEV